MKKNTQRKIITDASKRFESLVKAGADCNIAFKFYLAALKIDLKTTQNLES